MKYLSTSERILFKMMWEIYDYHQIGELPDFVTEEAKTWYKEMVEEIYDNIMENISEEFQSLALDQYLRKGI